MRVRMIVVDVDGTLTDERGVVRHEVIKALEDLSSAGFKVVLSSGNAFPIVAGLSYYLPVYRYAIAENGGVVGTKGWRKVLGSEEKARRARAIILERMGDVIYESWQNCYRHVDMAFHIKKGVDVEQVVSKLREMLKGLGVVVEHSGWALHVRDEKVDKGVGLLEACKDMGIKPEEVVAIGDSDTDVPMFKVAGFSIAMSNATPRLRAVASMVVSRGYYRGFLEAATYLLKAF